MIGQEFNGWVVVSRHKDNTPNGEARWILSDKLGNTRVVSGVVLRNSSNRCIGKIQDTSDILSSIEGVSYNNRDGVWSVIAPLSIKGKHHKLTLRNSMGYTNIPNQRDAEAARKEFNELEDTLGTILAIKYLESRYKARGYRFRSTIHKKFN